METTNSGPETTARVLLVGAHSRTELRRLASMRDDLEARGCTVACWRTGGPSDGGGLGYLHGDSLWEIVGRAEQVITVTAVGADLRAGIATLRLHLGLQPPIAVGAVARWTNAFSETLGLAAGEHTGWDDVLGMLGVASSPVSTHTTLRTLPRPFLRPATRHYETNDPQNGGHLMYLNRQTEIIQAGLDAVSGKSQSLHSIDLLRLIMHREDRSLPQPGDPKWAAFRWSSAVPNGDPLGDGALAMMICRGGVLRAALGEIASRRAGELDATRAEYRAERARRLTNEVRGITSSAELIAERYGPTDNYGAEDALRLHADYGFLAGGDPVLEDPLAGPLTGLSIQSPAFWLSGLQYHTMPELLAGAVRRVGLRAWHPRQAEYVTKDMVGLTPPEHEGDIEAWVDLIAHAKGVAFLNAIYDGVAAWPWVPKPIALALMRALLAGDHNNETLGEMAIRSLLAGDPLFLKVPGARGVTKALEQQGVPYGDLAFKHITLETLEDEANWGTPEQSDRSIGAAPAR